MLKTFLLFVLVAMLSRYRSHVNCSSIKVEANFTHKMNYRWDLRCSGVLRSVGS
jgi:hypothetical protein